MKKLAIKGHSIRGKEVIKLLEMLGGKNSRDAVGTNDATYYFIDEGGIIDYSILIDEDDDYVVFTFEEFLEKYPHKVGNKVLVDGYNYPLLIISMQWDGNTVKYLVSDDNNCNFWYTAENIENMNKIGNTTFMQLGKTIAVCFNKENYENEVELQLGDYEIVVRNGKTYAVLKKPEYPKTFEECLNILYCKSVLRTIIGHKAELLFNLEKLLICRDAYWKIYGEEIGLDKPWEPEYAALKDNTYFIIQTFNGEIDKSATSHRNAVLAFPTIEMRDTFYENFKDLIEQCKELL